MDELPPIQPPKPNLSAGGGANASTTTTKKIVVVMGATGTGKSQLAIDLAVHFPVVEIVNADSMQVYRGLDVLTNKVPLHHRQGVPHHLLGTIDPPVEFTSRDFRDSAVQIIDDIISRNGLPVIVGGTNYYIQALVSAFLVDDVVQETDVNPDSCCTTADHEGLHSDATFERLGEIDPMAASRIHPNDHRKINRYIDLYKSTGVRPSVLFHGKAALSWGRPDEFRYSCCFIWLDASVVVLDKFVDRRVDFMVEAGLLEEVYDIHKPNADYTCGLLQAIGVREFEEFFKIYFTSPLKGEQLHEIDLKQPKLLEILDSGDASLRNLLLEGIEKLKVNTRRLVRRQKRRLKRLESYFGWKFHRVDVSEALACSSGDSWRIKVVEPCKDLINTFLGKEMSSSFQLFAQSDGESRGNVSRDLWSQYTCEACGDQVLRGAHEWEQHKQGRRHRKRISRLNKKKKQTNNISGSDVEHNQNC